MEKRRKIFKRNKHSREPHNKLKNTAWNATKQALKRILEESDIIVAF